MEAPRILAVEDDPVLCQQYQLELSQAGYEVLTITTGLEALAVYMRFCPHLVLVDIELPGRLDGFGVVEELRRRGGCRIIVISGRSADPDRIRGLNLGADNYVPKPVHGVLLREYVRAALRRSVHGEILDELVGEFDYPEAYIDLSLGVIGRKADGVSLALGPIERSLLGRLLRTPGVAVPIAELLHAGWGIDQYPPDPVAVTNLESQVYRLRAKLGDKPGRGGDHLLFKLTTCGYGIRALNQRGPDHVAA